MVLLIARHDQSCAFRPEVPKSACQEKHIDAMLRFRKL